MRARLFCIALMTASVLLAQSRKNDRLNVSFNDQPLKLILDSISAQTNYFFSYNSNILPKGSRFTISANNIPIDQFLSKLLVGTGLKYIFFKDQIILTYEPPQKQVVRKRNSFNISGTIYDENGDPLNNANVFLDGTTIGMSSDIDGNYKLESIPPGFYDIVFSYVGYENAVYQLSEYNGGGRIQDHQMEISLGQLEEVEVISNRLKKSEKSWLGHYNVFKEELLGQTKNASDCVIENPENINFSVNSNNESLSAFSLKPIKIRNEALGYQISYFLESFSRERNNLRYRGKIRFRNMEPINRGERRKWKRNRQETYNGSFNHFKYALLNGNLEKEGFRIYSLKSIDKFKIEKMNALTENDIIVFKGDFYQLDFKNYLIIEYRKEKESKDFLSKSDFIEQAYPDFITKEGLLLKNPDHQISVLKLLKNGVRLDLSGEVMDRFGLTTYGYWAWERVADLVPVNYDPKYDNL